MYSQNLQRLSSLFERAESLEKPSRVESSRAATEEKSKKVIAEAREAREDLKNEIKSEWEARRALSLTCANRRMFSIVLMLPKLIA